MSNLSYYAAVSSDKGYVRANNEDNIFFIGTYLSADNRDEGINLSDIHQKEFLLYGIFDGMGGTEFGEEASLIASSVTNEYYSVVADTGVDNLDEFIGNIIKVSNRLVCEKMRQNNSGRMGSTVAFAAVYDNKVKIYNVGDSRVYIQKNNELKQISLDDSFAQRLYRMGIITQEEAAVHKDRNKLVQHLGIEENELVIEPHVSEEIEIYPGDKILLCSDGLTDMVSNERICEILNLDLTIAQKTEELVCEALANGGRDNISVILLEQCPQEHADVAQEETPHKSYLGHIIFLSFAVILALIALVYVCFQIIPDGDDNAQVQPSAIQQQVAQEDYNELYKINQ